MSFLFNSAEQASKALSNYGHELSNLRNAGIVESVWQYVFKASTQSVYDILQQASI